MRRLENIHEGVDRSAWVTSRSLPSLERSADLPLRLSDQRISPSVQNYRPNIISHAEIWTSCSPHVFSVYGYLSELIYFRFFPVICWSYLRTEMSVILSTCNKLPFSLSCETTLLMLSCDRIESIKSIHGTLSIAKLVYYIWDDSTWDWTPDSRTIGEHFTHGIRTLRG